jgi:hypothetical protein
MKPTKLPAPVLGIDVRSPETEVPSGAVRRATNVVLTDTGAFRRSPGSVLRGALDGAHSLCSINGTTLCAAHDKLYEVTLGNPTTYELIFTGLPLGEEVEYVGVGSEIYFTAGGVLGKLCADGLVRRPGVVDLIGFAPSLMPTVGGLTAGTYGVAYSVTNDLGEESPLSSPAWIDLPTGGGILLSGLVNATDVVKLNVYITAPDGREFYQNHSRAWAGSTSVTDQIMGRDGGKRGKVVMPGGNIVRYWHGRLVVASGGFLLFSDPFDRGLADPEFGWLAVGAPITVCEPVEGGVFVGTATEVRFYGGSGPEDLKAAVVSRHAAAEHSGATAPADMFDPKLVGETGLPVAVWLSDVGLMAGTPDGRVLPVQANRMLLSFDGPARPAIVRNGGVSQAIFSVESMVMGVGGPADSTL